jgi:hypothetical protein
MVQTVLLMISKTSASWQCGGASENAPDRVAAKPANGEKNVRHAIPAAPSLDVGRTSFRRLAIDAYGDPSSKGRR